MTAKSKPSDGTDVRLPGVVLWVSLVGLVLSAVHAGFSLRTPGSMPSTTASAFLYFAWATVTVSLFLALRLREQIGQAAALFSLDYLSQESQRLATAFQQDRISKEEETRARRLLSVQSEDVKALNGLSILLPLFASTHLALLATVTAAAVYRQWIAGEISWFALANAHLVGVAMHGTLFGLLLLIVRHYSRKSPSLMMLLPRKTTVC